MKARERTAGRTEGTRMRRLATALLAALLAAAVLPAVAFAADGGEINSGDTAWLLVATALVMVMLPGLALFYGGLVRRKNVLSTIMHSFFGLALVERRLGRRRLLDRLRARMPRGPASSAGSTSSCSTASAWRRPPAARSRSSCSPPSS